MLRKIQAPASFVSVWTFRGTGQDLMICCNNRLYWLALAERHYVRTHGETPNMKYSLLQTSNQPGRFWTVVSNLGTTTLLPESVIWLLLGCPNLVTTCDSLRPKGKKLSPVWRLISVDALGSKHQCLTRRLPLFTKFWPLLRRPQGDPDSASLELFIIKICTLAYIRARFFPLFQIIYWFIFYKFEIKKNRNFVAKTAH